MRRVVLANETDWEGWRNAARALALSGVAPADVRWAVRSHDEEGEPLQAAAGGFSVSRALVSLASLAIQARDPQRFDLLYRLVWQANAGEPADASETRRAQELAFAVRAEATLAATAAAQASAAAARAAKRILFIVFPPGRSTAPKLRPWGVGLGYGLMTILVQPRHYLSR